MADTVRLCENCRAVVARTSRPAVWARHYAHSFGKAQRDEARRRMLEHGFGA